MRTILVGLIIVVNFILQTTILPYFSIGVVVPHTGLIVVVSFALLRGSTEGAIIGACVGLLQDIFFGSSLGYYALLFLLMGQLIGKSQKEFYRENYLLPIIFCSLATIVFELINVVTGILSQGELHVMYILLRVIIPETIYTAIMTIPMYRILFGVNEFLELKEKYKYRLF